MTQKTVIWKTDKSVICADFTVQWESIDFAEMERVRQQELKRQRSEKAKELLGVRAKKREARRREEDDRRRQEINRLQREKERIEHEKWLNSDEYKRQREELEQRLREEKEAWLKTPIQVGDRVTNARGWHGVVKRIDKKTWPNPYYWVHWKERENHEDKNVRKFPQCGHTAEQIWKDDRETEA